MSKCMIQSWRSKLTSISQMRIIGRMNQVIEVDRTTISLFRRLIAFNFRPVSLDLGLLIFRIVFAVDLFLNHAMFKIPMLLGLTPARSPDPFQFGIIPTLAFSFLADGICSLLAMFGL